MYICIHVCMYVYICGYGLMCSVTHLIKDTLVKTYIQLYFFVCIYVQLTTCACVYICIGGAL